jgi:hypothetical protein
MGLREEWLARARRTGGERRAEGYWVLVAPVWDAVSIYDGPEVFLAQYAAAPEPSRVLLAAHWCQSEVCNGGFAQFFANSTGVLAPEAAAAFRAIGMAGAARVVEDAMACLGSPYPRDRDARDAALERLAATLDEDDDSAFDALDGEFYALHKREGGGFEAAADAYAARHAR